MSKLDDIMFVFAVILLVIAIISALSSHLITAFFFFSVSSLVGIIGIWRSL